MHSLALFLRLSLARKKHYGVAVQEQIRLCINLNVRIILLRAKRQVMSLIRFSLVVFYCSAISYFSFERNVAACKRIFLWLVPSPPGDILQATNTNDPAYFHKVVDCQ